VVALLLVLWELSGVLGLADQSFLPSLSLTLSAMAEMWERTHLFMHLMVSVSRVVAGLILAAAIGVPLAWAAAELFPWLYRRTEAMLRIFALINPYCLFPLFVVFFGSGEAAKISVLTWVSLWPIFFSTLSGVTQADPQLLKTARSMGAGRAEVFLRVVLPSALPSIFSGVRIGVQMSFFILIAAEMTGATAGLGWIVHSAGALNQVPRIYAAGVLIVLAGYGISRFLKSLRDGLFFWQPDSNPMSGASTHREKAKPISRLRLAAFAAVFLAVLGVGAYEIFRAEVILNDPSVIPEYRVWTE
jgi:NitT/TauT family transport system permease protein